MHGVSQGGRGHAATKVALVRTVLGGPPLYLGRSLHRRNRRPLSPGTLDLATEHVDLRATNPKV
jgi:hypothetical protein